MDSDEYDYGNDNCQKDPPAQLDALFNTGCHWNTIHECPILDQLLPARQAELAVAPDLRAVAAMSHRPRATESSTPNVAEWSYFSDLPMRKIFV